MSLEEVDFSLLNIIDGTFDLLELKAINQNVDFHVIYDPELPRTFKGDPGRIQQILLNIAGNAIKFTSKGFVSIRVSFQKKDESTYDIKFTIQDTGIGISKENLDKLFMPFTQAYPSMGRIFGGTGLGLPISNNLAKLMGGKVEATSTPSVGSTFVITLPLQESKDQSSDISHFRFKKTHAIITANQPIQRETLSSMLKTEGILTSQSTSLENVISLTKSAISGQKILWIVSCDQVSEKQMEEVADLIKIYKDSIIPLIFVRQQDLNKTNLPDEVAILGFPINRRKLIRRVADLMGVNGNRHFDSVTSTDLLKRIKFNELNVLLAEDNIINQWVTRAVLEQMGTKVDIAANGYEVIQMLNQIHYDLIIMDIRMPEMDGLEACKRIRESENNIPIIALTANAMQGDKEEFLKAGMNGYLSKPLMPDEMTQEILRILEPENIESDFAPKHVPRDKTLDKKSLLLTLGGKKKMASKVILAFQKQCNTITDTIKTALEEKDWKTASSAFHRLSGSAFAIQAQALGQAAGNLELVLRRIPIQAEELEISLLHFKEEQSRLQAWINTENWD